MKKGMRRAVLAATAAVFAAGTMGVATRAFAAPAAPRVPVSALKIMNYYPAAGGWTDMWTNYSHATTVSDFAAIRSLNANTVRIIVQPGAVGFPVVMPSMRSELDDMINVAHSDGLSVQLTLFDWWSNYADISGSEQWVQSLLQGETTNPTIALVELQNEMPLNTLSVNWAKAMLPYLATLLPGVPRTVSEPGSGGTAAIQTLLADIPSADLDAVDVHYYGDPALAAAELTQVQAMAGSKPVFVGETGVSTFNTAAGEEEQARYYEVMAETAKDLGLPAPSPWMLNDVAFAGALPQPPSAEYFGLRRPDGSWKPAASVVQQMFSGATPENWDGTFVNESAGLAPVLGAWTEYDTVAGTPVVTSGLSASGGNSVCFSGTRGSSSALPSVEQTFPVLTKGETFTVTGWVERQNGTGVEQISIAAFDANGDYLGQGSSANAVGSGYWQKLTFSGAVPAGVTNVQIHLKAGNETGSACWSDVSITDSAP